MSRLACVALVAVLACGGSTEPDRRANWYAGEWIASGVTSGGIKLDSLTVSFSSSVALHTQLFYWESSNGTKSTCGGFIYFVVSGDTLRTARDAILEPNPRCGEVWYMQTYVRDGSAIATTWGGQRLTLRRSSN